MWATVRSELTRSLVPRAAGTPQRAYPLPESSPIQDSWKPPIGVALRAGWEALTPALFAVACDTRHCPEPEACPKGSHAVQTYKEAACCPTYNCSECPGSAAARRGSGAVTWDLTLCRGAWQVL